MRDIVSDSILHPFASLLITGWDLTGEPYGSMTLEDIHRQQPSWIVSDMVKGLACLRDAGAAGIETGIKKYDAARQMDPSYPPAYLVRAVDDPVIPVSNGDSMQAAAKRNHIPFFMEEASSGSHGFGLGTGTGAQGWVRRMEKWMTENLNQ